MRGWIESWREKCRRERQKDTARERANRYRRERRQGRISISEYECET